MSNLWLRYIPAAPFYRERELAPTCVDDCLCVLRALRGSFFLGSRLSVLLQQWDEFMEVGDIMVCL
jgi:hypothetical protein